MVDVGMYTESVVGVESFVADTTDRIYDGSEGIA